MIAIVSPLSIELQGLRRLLKVEEQGALGDTRFYKGTMNDCEVLLAHTGVGGERAQCGLRDLIDKFSPEWIVIVGYCGGTHTRLKAGDLLICHRIMQYEGPIPTTGTVSPEEEYYSNHEMVVRAVRILENANLEYQRGGCVTVRRVCPTKADKEWVGDTFPVLAVEMENSFFASTAKEQNVPLLAVRVILDPLETNLPDMSLVLDHSGQPSKGKILGHCFSHPLKVLQCLRMCLTAKSANKRITEFVVGLLQEL